ncbi:hypothetical protein [Streptacidiphilus jiangxiensis]|uniref:TrbL/VirB6 plasmid conjugal transfer protein n=1 Tax=Streptacidiphilus jiangxiensis TaxID=235985 RepID=A0A1H8AP10_STRJI|nr:hypothetical protein [Streptacidiphilus jiangxiensis]SEM72293.1 hypothetical protein SAMN05414137_1483 [Streptacidiphilus jiangxiensis]
MSRPTAARATAARAIAPRAAAPRGGRGRRLVMVAVLIGLLVALFTSIAWADTPVPSPQPGPGPSAPGSTPTSKPTPKPSPTPAPTSTDPAAVPSINPTPSPGLTGVANDPGPEKNLAQPPSNGSGILAPFNGHDEYGAPLQVYNVNVDTGSWDDFDLKIWGFLTSLFFTIAKWLIGFVCWLVSWALNFGLAKIMVTPVADISATIRDQVINRLGLVGLFLTFAALYGGWHILFRQRARGFAEAGISLVVAAIAATVLLSPAQVLLGTNGAPAAQGSDMLLSDDGVVGKSKDLSLQVSNLVLSQNPNSSSSSPDSVASPITTGLIDAFVVEPTELMTYGKIFTGNCAKAYAVYSIVQYNANNLPSGQSQETRYQNQINDAANKFKDTCQTKDFNPNAQKASADTAFSALFVAIAAIICVILITLVSGGFLVAQGWVAFEAIRAPWALTVGILPGGGRATLWRWVSAIIKAILAVVLSVLFLAIFILMILALLKSDTGNILAVKFLSIDLVAVAGLAGHKKIKETARQVAVGINRKLANAKVGGARRSAFAAPGRYAETAPSLKQIWGEGKSEARKVTQPLAKVGRSAKDLWVGPQAGRRGAAKGGRLGKAVRAATTVATAVGTGGTAAAAKVAAQQASKKALTARLAARMSNTRGGRATLAAGKAAVGTTKFAAKYSFLASPAGWPVAVPRTVAATKRGAANANAAAVRAEQAVGAAAKRQWKRGWTDTTKPFLKEYGENSMAAGRAVRRGAKFVADSVWDSSSGTSGPGTPTASPRRPTPGPARPPAATTAPTTTVPAGSTPTAPATGSTTAPSPTPSPAAAAGRPRRRATRPAGPPSGGRP